MKMNPKSRAVPIFLRSLEETDIERTFRWHNDARLYEKLGDPFRPVSKTTELDWLRQKASYSVTEINLAICLNRNGEHIGNIYLREIDWIARKAASHIFIGNDKHRGKGYGQAAVCQLLQLAFLDLNLNRIFLQVLAGNVAAVKLYEKCGFELEGRLKMHAFKHGQYQDILVMGFSSEKFQNRIV
jgi:RimJ/RimL family protein N-acetyltransferase